MVCSSRIKKGKDHPGYGIKRPMSPQQREKQKGKNKGNLWWNNGKEQVMSPRSLGDDWIRGRLAFNNAERNGGITAIRQLWQRKAPDLNGHGAEYLHNRTVSVSEAHLTALFLDLL